MRYTQQLSYDTSTYALFAVPVRVVIWTRVSIVRKPLSGLKRFYTVRSFHGKYCDLFSKRVFRHLSRCSPPLDLTLACHTIPYHYKKIASIISFSSRRIAKPPSSSIPTRRWSLLIKHNRCLITEQCKMRGPNTKSAFTEHKKTEKQSDPRALCIIPTIRNTAVNY